MCPRRSTWPCGRTFYEATGAILDMLVTHLFQVRLRWPWNRPPLLEPECLAEAREDVIGCFRPLTRADVVVGQYEGYRDIEGVPNDSRTETFVAAKCGSTTTDGRGCRSCCARESAWPKVING